MNGINKDVFIRKYVDAFGEKAELPIVFYYDDKPAGVNEKTGGCFFKCFDSVRNGRAISLSAETIGCGGGKLYTGFAPMPPHASMPFWSVSQNGLSIPSGSKSRGIR